MARKGLCSNALNTTKSIYSPKPPFFIKRYSATTVQHRCPLMKKRKKPKGTKARVQASKKKLAYIGTAITVTILVAIIAVSSFFIYSFLNPSPNQNINPDQTNDQPSQFKAAIVDHLSLTAPNRQFKENAIDILKTAGYTVNYYPGEEVTVDFYRNLPTHGYRLIILRVHSSATWGADVAEAPVTLFTSERISQTKYVYEQLHDQLLWVSYSDEEAKRGVLYFGIAPPFVTQSMNGRFQNTVVIMMGCEGLDNPLMAKAFVEKGAKVYISWDKPVLASHTDQATSHLLQHFLIEKRTLKESIQETFKEVGADPEYESLLVYYPPQVGEQAIEDITGNPKTNQ